MSKWQTKIRQPSVNLSYTNEGNNNGKSTYLQYYICFRICVHLLLIYTDFSWRTSFFCPSFYSFFFLICHLEIFVQTTMQMQIEPAPLAIVVFPSEKSFITRQTITSDSQKWGPEYSNFLKELTVQFFHR